LLKAFKDCFEFISRDASPDLPGIKFDSRRDQPFNETVVPWGENLIALLSRLVKIWMIRSGSTHWVDTVEPDKVTPALSAIAA